MINAILFKNQLYFVRFDESCEDDLIECELKHDDVVRMVEANLEEIIKNGGTVFSIWEEFVVTGSLDGNIATIENIIKICNVLCET